MKNLKYSATVIGILQIIDNYNNYLKEVLFFWHPVEKESFLSQFLLL